MYFCSNNIINGINKLSMKKILFLFLLVLTTISSYAQVNPPTAITARQDGTDNKAIIEWTAASGVAGYKVFYKVKGAPVSTQDTIQTTTSSVHLTNLTLDTAYVVKVKAFTVTTSPPDTTYSTNTDSVIVVISSPLVKPSISIETTFTTDTSITFHLVDTTNVYETGYEITLEAIGHTVTLTTDPVDGERIITAQNLKPKTSYTITAKAVRAVGTFPASDPSDAKYETTKVALPPEAIAFKTEKDCPYGVVFSWDYAERQEDIVYVDIEAGTDGWNFETVGSVSPSDRYFYFSGAEPGQVYYYRVVTHNATGTTRSGPYAIFTQRYVAPNEPKNFQSLQDDINKSSTWLTVAWDHGDQDLTCYTNITVNTELRISINGGDWQTIENFPEYIRQYRLEGLNPGDVVEFSIRSHSDKGHLSDWVNTTDNTYGPPSVPQNFTGVDGVDNFGNKVLYLSWTDTADEDWYIIEKSYDNGVTFIGSQWSPSENSGPAPFAVLKEDVTKLTDTQLEEGVSYFYRIKAVNWVGESGYLTRGPFYISYTSAPNAPYGLVAKRNGNGVDLSWVDDTIKEEKYYVEKSTDGGQSYIVMSELGRDATKTRDENVTAGQTYYYRVRAWNAAFQYSPYSKPAVIEIPAATSGFVFDATVYPNPVSETLNIKAEGVKAGAAYHLRIFDSNNHLVVDKQVTFGEENTASVSIRSLVPGAYHMTLSDGKEKVAKKIIKL